MFSWVCLCSVLSLERTHFCGRFRHSQLFRVSLLCPSPSPHFVYGQWAKIQSNNLRSELTQNSKICLKKPIHRHHQLMALTVTVLKNQFLQFLSGGSGLVQFVLITELVGIQHRHSAGIISFFAWATSLMTIPLFAYFIRDWKLLNTVLSALGLPSLFFWW